MTHDYQVETINAIRNYDSRFECYFDETIALAYHQWSEESYCAGWLSLDKDSKVLKAFTKWAFTRPIDSIVSLTKDVGV